MLSRGSRSGVGVVEQPEVRSSRPPSEVPTTVPSEVEVQASSPGGLGAQRCARKPLAPGVEPSYVSLISVTSQMKKQAAVERPVSSLEGAPAASRAGGGGAACPSKARPKPHGAAESGLSITPMRWGRDRLRAVAWNAMRFWCRGAVHVLKGLQLVLRCMANSFHRLVTGWVATQ